MLDSRPKGRGFEPHRCHCVVVLEQGTFILSTGSTQDRRQSKTILLSANVDQNSLETEFSIGICRPTGDKWQSKTLFLASFDPCSSIVKSVCDCRLSGVVTVTLYRTVKCILKKFIFNKWLAQSLKYCILFIHSVFTDIYCGYYDNKIVELIYEIWTPQKSLSIFKRSVVVLVRV